MNRFRILFLSLYFLFLTGLNIRAQESPVMELHLGLLYNPSIYGNSPLNTGLNGSFAYCLDRNWLAGLDFGACYPGTKVTVSPEELGSGIFWTGGSAQIKERMLKSWGGLYMMYRFMPLSPVNFSLFAQGTMVYTSRTLENTDLLNAAFYSWYDSNYGPRTAYCFGGGLVMDFQVSRKSTLRLTLADRDLSSMLFKGYDDRMLSHINYAEKRATQIDRNQTQMNSREVSIGVVFRIGQKKL